MNNRTAKFQSYRRTFFRRTEGMSKALLSNMYMLSYGEFLPKDRSVKILDAGCGGGEFISFLRELGYKHIIGVDIDEDSVQYAKQNLGLEDIFCADIVTYLEDTSERFDLVVLNDVLEHFPKWEGIDLLKRIYAILRTEGYLFVKTPNMGNPFNLRSRYMDITHEVGFTKTSLEQILRLAGFDITALFPEPYRSCIGLGSRLMSLLDKTLFKLVRWFVMRAAGLHFAGTPGKNLIAIGVKPMDK